MSETVLCLMGSNPTGDAPFSCALQVGGAVHVARSEPGRRGDLATLVRDLCAAHGVDLCTLGELRIDLGPGSYTGLRVAVTFARFLQHFGGTPVRATDTLSVLALAAPAGAWTRIVPVLDARRGRLHAAALHTGGAHLMPAEPPRALAPGEFAAMLRPGDLVVGPAAVEALVAPLLGDTPFAAVAGADASLLLSPRLTLHAHTAAELEPKYLMGSYAE